MPIVRLLSKSTMNASGTGKNVIEPGILADLIKKGLNSATLQKLVIVDCRRFLDYNTSHIKNAINVCCSKLIRKRLQENKLSILDIIRPNIVEAGMELAAVESSEIHVQATLPLDVVLYADQNGTSNAVSNTRQDRCCVRKCIDDVSFLSVLMEKLSATSRFGSVWMLNGSFVDFQTRYPELCEGAAGMLGGIGSPLSGRSSTSGLGVASKLTLTSLSQPCLPVSNQGPTKILPFLYLGSQQDAMDQETLSKYGIDYILNMSVGCPKPDFVQDEHFMRIAVNDSHSEKLLPYFERAFEFLDKVKEANSCVLVHCLAGISRSPTLAIAFVMRHLNLSQEEAYSYVKKRRPAISPNFNFLGQLLEYERQLKASRQTERQQSDQPRDSFNVLPSPCSTSEDTIPCSAPITKPVSSSPNNFNFTKPNLFLNLQNTNCPAKVSVTLCSSNSELAETSDATSMKRSSSCPVKIQRSGIGNCLGPVRESLNLDFEFSPAQRTNVNGKRQMIASFANCSTLIQSEMTSTVEDKSLQQQHCLVNGPKDFMERFDKAHCGVRTLKPLHEELPSPSTELSKLNFDNSGASVCDLMDVDTGAQNSLPAASSDIPTLASPFGCQLRCPNSKVQIPTFSTSTKSPLVSTGTAERRSAPSVTSPFITCATNPFFRSSFGNSGSDDFNRYSKGHSKAPVRAKMDVESDSSRLFKSIHRAPLVILEEPSEETLESDRGSIDEEMNISTSFRSSPIITSQFSDDGKSPVLNEFLTSLENPLFQRMSQGSFKRHKTHRRASLSEVLDRQSNDCPMTAPVISQTTISPDQTSKIRSIRSESQIQRLTTSSPTFQLAGVRQKLTNARAMIVSSFSQKLRHLLAKRASWPHAAPYLSGLPMSETEPSRLWALAPESTKKLSDPEVPWFLEKATEESGELKSTNALCPGMYTWKRESPTNSETTAYSSSGTSGSSSATSANLLAPIFDIDSPESGFVESPTALNHQRECTPSSSTTAHSSTSASSNIFLHRDPERDSLGSTSSLEIAVS